MSLTYANNGADAIQDVTIQSENVSYPENGSVSVGLRSYGISRLLMKFPGIDFSEYAGVTVTSATVSLRDLMCESTEMTVYCYPFTGSAWEESSASWSSVTQSWGSLLDSKVLSYSNGLTQETAHYYAFDISDAVQAWIDGDADAAKGILFKASDTVETAGTLESRVFGSFERESYKPIFSMTYNNNISLDQNSLELYVGDSVTLTATTYPEGQTVIWNSTVPGVATVAGGLVTAVSAGQTTITATLEDGTSAQCTVIVYAKSVTLTPDSVEVYKGDAVTITAATIPDGENVVWTSSNESVATVSGGEVTTLSEGQTVIRAAINNEVFAECTVTVVEFALKRTSVDVDETQSVTLSVVELLDGYTVTWTSADVTVATVDSAGKVTGVKAGKTTITASVADNISATCTVYVTIADGVYYIKNAANGFSLVNGESAASTVEAMLTQPNTSTNDVERAWQLWKITYVSDGYYIIRPMNRLMSCLAVNGQSDVLVKDMTGDDASDVSTAGWTITYHENLGYAFQCRGFVYFTMRPAGAGAPEGDNVILSAYSATTQDHWTLEKAYGVFLRNMETLRIIDSSVPIYVNRGSSVSYSSLGYACETVGNMMGLSWAADNTTMIAINQSGIATINSGGTAKITLTVVLNAVSYSTFYTVEAAQDVFYIDNYYDSSISITDELVLVDDAVYFASKGYYDLFGVGFSKSGEPVLEDSLRIDECSLGGNVLCTTDDCGEICATMHHKSRHRILSELATWSRDTNHITVLWSSRPTAAYCVVDSETGGHRSTIAIAQARLGGSATHIMTIGGTTSYTREVYMALVLAHELAHNMGLPEVNTLVDGHEKAGTLECAMEAYETTNDAHIIFYEEVLDGTSDLFCDYCQGQLKTLITDKYVDD